jgi:hypothetical protein
MTVLSEFSTPANIPEPSDTDRAEWSAAVSRIVRPFAARFPQFYDPTREDTPGTARRADIVWAAFPARLLRGATSERQRWALADSSRDQQDEYC